MFLNIFIEISLFSLIIDHIYILASKNFVDLSKKKNVIDLKNNNNNNI